MPRNHKAVAEVKESHLRKELVAAKQLTVLRPRLRD